MGYCYTRNGLLVCDRCGHAGGVRRRKCPYGYCPAPALCEACWKDPAVRKEFRDYHVKHGCKEAHEKYVAETKARKIGMDTFNEPNKVRVVTLGDGRRVSLRAYVKGMQTARDNPTMWFKDGLDGCGATGAEVFARFYEMVRDHCNRGLTIREDKGRWRKRVAA